MFELTWGLVNDEGICRVFTFTLLSIMQCILLFFVFPENRMYDLDIASSSQVVLLQIQASIGVQSLGLRNCKLSGYHQQSYFNYIINLLFTPYALLIIMRAN